jgi:hypothetical protein
MRPPEEPTPHGVDRESPGTALGTISIPITRARPDVMAGASFGGSLPGRVLMGTDHKYHNALNAT